MTMNRAYVYRTSLRDLIGDSKTLDLIERAVTLDRQVVEKALVDIYDLICPYPAVRVANWFWETEAGQAICRAEWSIYQFEAIRPFQACRILYGRNGLKELRMIWVLHKKDRLPIYWLPRMVAEYWPKNDQIRTWPTYLRREDVVRIRDSKDYTGYDELIRPKKQWLHTQELRDYSGKARA